MGVRTSIRRFIDRRFSRAAHLRRLTIARTKQCVFAGPFQGMQYVDRSIGSAYLPKLLGIYEREIYPVIEEVVQGEYDSLIDIGAAEGFFAVGLALRQPSPVIAFESDEEARGLAQEVARKNQVENRIDFQETCTPIILESLLAATDRPFILCDVDGGEADLLDLQVVPSLGKTALLVELHEYALPGITAELFRRFSDSHQMKLIWQKDREASDFPFEDFWSRRFARRYFSRAVDENRPCQQSWLWMTPLASQSQGGHAVDGKSSQAA